MNPLHAKRNTRHVPFLFALGVLMLVVANPAFAKTAEEYLHGASYQYVAGKIQEASVEAEEGLRVHPGDPRLETLAEHLRKMKDEQRGNSGQGEGNQDKKNPQDEQQDQDRNEGKDQDRDGQNGDRQGDKADEKNRQPPQDDESSGDGERDGERPPQPRAMSEEEAKRLLNSFADEEKKEQAERRKVIRSRAGTEQDW